MSDELILVQNLIHEIRGQKVMLDFDLARLYQVKTGEVKMMSQIVISSKRKASAPPFAFTEQGVAMLSGLLQREDDLGAVNDLSEDVRKDIDNLYLAIGELSSRMEEKKAEPRRKIGFQQNMED